MTSIELLLQSLSSIAAAIAGEVPSNAGAVDLTAGDYSPPSPARIYVGGTGHVILDMLGGQGQVAFQSVPAGTFINVKVTKVRKSGTTATALTAIW
jgi:hypothetical protein